MPFGGGSNFLWNYNGEPIKIVKPYKSLSLKRLLALKKHHFGLKEDAFSNSTFKDLNSTFKDRSEKKSACSGTF
jgi:hypothetical protein